MALWDYSTRPTWVNGAGHRKSRNVIATDAGWVYRQSYTDTHSTYREKDEVLVSIRNLANTAKAGFPDVQEMYFANTTGGTVLQTGQVNYLYVVWDEPLTFSNGTAAMTLNISNTAGGDNLITATMNNDIASIGNANNTLVFQWTANTAGEYKVETQTVANTVDNGLVSLNSDGEAANLVIGVLGSNNVWVGGSKSANGTITIV